MRKLLPLVVIAAGATALFAWTVLNRNDLTDANGSPLSYAPADAVFAMGMVEPFPSALANSWADRMDPLVPIYAAQLRHAADLSQQSDEAPPAVAKLLRALAEELDGKTTRAVMAGIGLSPNARMAAYGLGLVPVLRWELDDADAFRAFVARIEERTGETLPIATVDGQDYWRLPAAESPIEPIAAVIGSHLVISAAPADASPAALQAVLGLDAPDPSLLDSDTFSALAETFGYEDTLIGFFDSGRFAAALTSEATPLEQAFLQAMDVEKPQFDQVCSEEIKALALTWPRASFGYTALNAEHMRVRAVLETTEELAADLMTLRAPMPALDAIDADTAFNVGFSFNLDALPAFVNKRADAIAAAPWQCPSLAWLNSGSDQARAGINNPALFAAAPVFRGFHAIVQQFELDAQMQPTALAGALILGSANPKSLLAMAAMALPQAAELKLEPDGSVKPLPLPPIPNAPADLQAFVAMTDNLLGIAFGAGAEQELPTYMQVDAAQQPLLVFGYSGRLYETLGKIIAEGAAALPDPAMREQMEQQGAIMRDVYAAWIVRADLRLELTEHGIEMLQDVHTRP